MCNFVAIGSNVFLFKASPYVKLGGYPLSKQLSGDITVANTFVGTFRYMGPELLLHEGRDEPVYNPMQADMHSMGVLIWEILSGTALYSWMEDGLPGIRTAFLRAVETGNLHDHPLLLKQPNPPDMPQHQGIINTIWECMKQMLMVDPRGRLTIDDFMNALTISGALDVMKTYTEA